MAEQYRARADEWRDVKALANDIVTYSCLLELLCRIEALEVKEEGNNEAWAAMRRAGSSAADQIGALMKRIEHLEAAQQAQPNHPAKPDSSLVERVAFALTGDRDGLINWKPEARAAIREVALWLSEHAGGTRAAWMLEQEAER